MTLTNKQAAFVSEYLKDKNATQAAIRAGYSEKTATEQGSRLLTNVNVAQEVSRRMSQAAANADVTAENIIKGLNDIAVNNEEPAAARVRSYELLGKHLGMFVERQINTNLNYDVSDEVMDPEEWARQSRPS